MKFTYYKSEYDCRFEGGGSESQAFVVEGLGVALDIFDDMEQSRLNKKLVQFDSQSARH